MAVKRFKPTTPTLRYKTVASFAEITKTRPERSLIEPLRSTGGRNNQGRATARFRGGGHKRMYRIIDFRRDKRDMPAKVAAIEYDPNRSARIALLHYTDGEKRYILAPDKLGVGDTIVAGENAEVKVGNALPLRKIPLGMTVHNVELSRGRGGQLVRSAGAAAQLMAREGKHAHLRLPSGEVRLVDAECYATLGQVGHIEHESIAIGKAGRSRWLGRRPAPLLAVGPEEQGPEDPEEKEALRQDDRSEEEEEVGEGPLGGRRERRRKGQEQDEPFDEEGTSHPGAPPEEGPRDGPHGRETRPPDVGQEFGHPAGLRRPHDRGPQRP